MRCELENCSNGVVYWVGVDVWGDGRGVYLCKDCAQMVVQHRQEAIPVMEVEDGE